MIKIFLIIIIPFFALAQLDESIFEDDYKSEASVKKKEFFYDSANIRAINKISAENTVINLKINHKKSFGNIDLNLIKCWQSSPEEEPVSKALLNINEQIPGELEKNVFYGWLFSSSPAISALEHPVYSFVLINCEGLSED